MIELGQWLPDLPAFENPGATVAKNVVPLANSYGPFKALSTISDALTARARGAASAAAPDGNTLTFAGDATKLYSLSGSAFSDVSKVGGYTTAATERWVFANYGGLLIASNYSDAIQSWTLGTSTAFADLTSDATATKNAPKARHLAVVRDFLVCGNLNDNFDGVTPSRLQWGPIGDPAGDWTPSLTTQADFNDILTGGPINGLVGGEYGAVFCERAIHRMTFVGTPAIFQFDEVERNRGLIAPGSLATTGRLSFFLDEDGFYAFDGAQATPIGADKVDKTFLADVDAAYFDRMSAAVDPTRKLYALAYAGAGNSGGTPNKILLLNWQTGRWTIVETEVEMIARTRSTATTLEQLDDISASIDALTTSLDNRLFAGGAGLFAGFSAEHKLGSFTGANLAATVETGEFAPHAPRLTYINGVQPITDATCTVQLGTRSLQSGTVSWGDASTPETDTGYAPFRSEARYHRARLNLSGDDWSHAQGIEVDAMPAGLR